jgi:hypothetical protein
MKLRDVGVQIAARVLDLAGGEVTVVLGKPEKFSGAEDHYCPYQIIGLGNERVRYAGGIDAVQALLLALKMIGADLYTSPEAQAKQLTWQGGGSHGDLGFPVPETVRDLAP